MIGPKYKKGGGGGGGGADTSSYRFTISWQLFSPDHSYFVKLTLILRKTTHIIYKTHGLSIW